jgi:DNA-binding winged helix-turn-helix (wHTH) protein/tetratricopeptide (TPR) repeat protein/TolB-like protein
MPDWDKGSRRDGADKGMRSGDGTPGSEIITFGEFHIDPARRRLARGGRHLRIQRKPLDVLIYLASHRNRVVTRDELLEAFWSHAVNEEVLTRCVSILRRLLDDARDPPRYIETVWGEGYRFIAPARVGREGDPDASEPRITTTGRHGGGETPRPSPDPGRPPDRPSKSGGFGRGYRIAAGVLTTLLALAAVTIWRSHRPFDPSVDRIAVLPMSSDDDADGWLAEALTDHLARTVSRIEGLTVVAPGSAERFSDRSDPGEIGRRLGVGAVLASQLHRVGDLSGLRAQLVSTGDGTVLWSVEVPPTAVDLEPRRIEQLAVSVARRLWANLQLREPSAVVDGEAYRHYLRGRYYWNQRSIAGLEAAIESYERALAIEPGYVDALVGLADSWLLLPLYGAVPPAEAIPKAREAARRALERDRGAAHAFAVLGVVATQYDWNWTEAEALLRRALTLNPNNATAEQWLGELYCYRLRSEDCRRHLRAAVGLDPLSPVLRMLQGSPALFSGDFEEAVSAYSRALEESPGFPLGHYVLGLAHTGLGDWDRAIDAYRASLPDLGLAIVGGPLVYALAKRGDTEGARTMLEEMESLARTRYVPPTKFTVAWLGLGDRKRAVEWLDRALEARDDRLVYLAVDVHFLDLHGDPDFRALAERVGLLDVLRPR